MTTNITNSQGYELIVTGHLAVKTLDVIIKREDLPKFANLVDAVFNSYQITDSRPDVLLFPWEWDTVEDRDVLHITVKVKHHCDKPVDFTYLAAHIRELPGNMFIRCSGSELQGFWLHPDTGDKKPL